MEKTDQAFQDEARDVIFKVYLDNHPNTDPSTYDVIKTAISLSLEIAGRDFQAVMKATTLSLILPPDVDYETGTYSYFSYTISDSPTNGRVVQSMGRMGLSVTPEKLLDHYETLKDVLNHNTPTQTQPPSKH